MQRRFDEHPEKMHQRREIVEHPFGTINAWMGPTHFLMKTLKRVSTEMALHVPAYRRSADGESCVLFLHQLIVGGNAIEKRRGLDSEPIEDFSRSGRLQ